MKSLLLSVLGIGSEHDLDNNRDAQNALGVTNSLVRSKLNKFVFYFSLSLPKYTGAIVMLH